MRVPLSQEFARVLHDYPLFDAHLHIIDPDYPLIPNQGYLPAPFTCDHYLDRLSDYRLVGGAVVSGSFQGFDQSYLRAALGRLGPGFVGVTQLPAEVSDAELLELDRSGVRGLRFNLRRGGSEGLDQLERMAGRVFELAGWHTELYVDASLLPELTARLLRLPAVSIDHLGLSLEGLPHLLRLVEHGVRVKACGFGRGDLDIPAALRALYRANPQALMFGTDLPCTRAPRAYRDDDWQLVVETLGERAAYEVFSANALAWYRQEVAGMGMRRSAM